jgi:hypothetical protein
MSSQPFAVDFEDHQASALSSEIVAQPARPSCPWYQSRLYRILFGLGIGLIGVSKFCNGLVLLTGATNYGSRMEINHSDLYYTAAVSKHEAQALGDYFVKEQIFDGKTHLSMQLTKEGKTLQIRFPVKPGFDKDESYVASVGTIGHDISQKVFRGALVAVDLCDTDLKTLRVIPARSRRSDRAVTDDGRQE